MSEPSRPEQGDAGRADDQQAAAPSAIPDQPAPAPAAVPPAGAPTPAAVAAQIGEPARFAAAAGPAAGQQDTADASSPDRDPIDAGLGPAHRPAAPGDLLPPAQAAPAEQQPATTDASVPVREGEDPASFGRVDADGTVYVKTADGERAVGQVPDASAEEALAFYVRRFTAIEVEVEVLEQRLANQAVNPDDATHAIRKIRGELAEARAVGDLAGLAARLDALTPVINEARATRRAERARQSEQTRAAKEQMVAEAERLAQSNDWRGGVNRFRALLDQWKALPRLDRSTDDALWHRFSSARTTYTKRRKAQFAQQAERREEARRIKQRLVKDAERLATSTDWGPTASAFRELMQQWKAAGPAPREVEDELWAAFRGHQDTFFTARQEAQNSQDAELRANAVAKAALLDEFEPQIVPVIDVDGSRRAYRALLDRWAEIGRVPRDDVRPLDGRLRKLEQAVRGAEEERWRRTNPEARARAEDTATKLRDQIATQEEKAARAEARGDAKSARQAREAAETYRSWLRQAEAAAADFGG